MCENMSAGHYHIFWGSSEYVITPSQTLNSYTGCQVCKVSAVPAPLTFQVVLSLSSSARNYFLSVSFPSSSVNTSSSPPLLLWLILFSLTTVPLQFFSTAHPWIGTRLSLLSSPFLSRPVPPSLLDHPLSSLALDIFLSCSGSFHPILFFCLVFSPAWSLPLIFLNSALLLRAKYFWVNYSQRSRTTRPQANNKDILFNTLLSAYYHEGCQVQTMKKKEMTHLGFLCMYYCPVMRRTKSRSQLRFLIVCTVYNECSTLYPVCQFLVSIITNYIARGLT